MDAGLGAKEDRGSIVKLLGSLTAAGEEKLRDDKPKGFTDSPSTTTKDLTSRLHKRVRLFGKIQRNMLATARVVVPTIASTFFACDVHRLGSAERRLSIDEQRGRPNF